MCARRSHPLTEWRKLIYFSCLREYNCFLLSRPVDSVSALQMVETMAMNDLESTFLEDFYMLDRSVLNRQGCERKFTTSESTSRGNAAPLALTYDACSRKVFAEVSTPTLMGGEPVTGMTLTNLIGATASNPTEVLYH